MSKKTGVVYTEEFRESSIKLALESKNSIAQTARDLGIKINTLHTWISKYREGRCQDKSSRDENLEAELKKLKKENLVLTQERDILKKAAAYFAKQTL